MAQFGRPISDVQWSLLGATPINTVGNRYQNVDEATPVDTDYVYSQNNPGGGSFVEFGLTSLTDPTSSTGHILRIRTAQIDEDSGAHPQSPNTGGTATTCGWQLRQGATVIASGTINPGNFVTTTYNLTGAEADAITNYADLRVYMNPGGGGGSTTNRRAVAISWVELEIPDAASGNYDESISINSNASISPTNLMDLVASMSITSLSSILSANNSIMDASASFGANANISESGGLDFQESISLALQSALSTSVNLEINGTVTIISNSSVAIVNNANLNNAVAIASSPGIFVNGNLDMDATVSLLASAIVLSNGGSVFEASIGISSNTTLSTLLEAILGSEITIGSISQIIANANIDSDATISLGANNILSVNGGLFTNENVSFGSIINILASGGLTLDGNITLSMIASIDPQNNSIANVSITISSASLIGIVGDGGSTPVVNVIINAKVPIGKHIDNIIVGSYVKNDPKNGKHKEIN